MFDVEAAKQAGKSDEDIALFLAQTFKYPTHLAKANPQKTIEKLRKYSPGGATPEKAIEPKEEETDTSENDERSRDFSILSHALDSFKDATPGNDGHFNVSSRKVLKQLEESGASKKMLSKYTELLSHIKSIDKPSQMLISQLNLLSKSPLGQFVMDHLVEDNLTDEMMNPYFNLKLVSAALDIPNAERSIEALLKSSKGHLNSTVAVTALNLLITDARPKLMKQILSQAKNAPPSPSQPIGMGGPPTGAASPQGMPPVATGAPTQPPTGISQLLGQ